MLELKEKLTVFARQNGIQIELLIDQIDSTNNRAAQKCYGAGDVIIAETQSAGRGQRNSWSSLPGQNLTFSVVLQPDFLLAERQFRISKTAALAVADTIADTGAYSIDQVAQMISISANRKSNRHSHRKRDLSGPIYAAP